MGEKTPVIGNHNWLRPYNMCETIPKTANRNFRAVLATRHNLASQIQAEFVKKIGNVVDSLKLF